MSEFLTERIVTGEQIKGARAMPRLDQRQFAALTYITVGMVRRMERTLGPITADPSILETMFGALQGAGVELIDVGHYEGLGGPGLRLTGLSVAPDDVIDLETIVEERRADERAMPEAS